MQETIEKMIKKMQERVKTQEFMEKHRSNASDFMRKRNLSFDEVVNFVIGNLGTTLDFEVLNFIRGREQPVTSSAISQARDKIKYEAFEEIFRESSREVAINHTYRGYRLMNYFKLTMTNAGEQQVVSKM